VPRGGPRRSWFLSDSLVLDVFVWLQGAGRTPWHTRGVECQSTVVIGIRRAGLQWLSYPGARVWSVSELTVYLDGGPKRTFACALDWPGWARSGRGEEAAVAELLRYLPRYAAVAARAGLEMPDVVASEVRVVERLPGSASTDFGALGAPPEADRRPLPSQEAARQADLLEAAWAVLDDVVAVAPQALRKGPRGGGRDRDAVMEHVLASEVSYARQLGVKAPRGADQGGAAAAELRAAVVAALREAREPVAPTPKGWPPRYTVRRFAWHVLDHAWEIEDRGTPAPQG